MSDDLPNFPSNLGVNIVAPIVKNLPAIQETWVQFLDREDPLEKNTQPTPEILLGEFNGQRSMAGYSSWGHKRAGHD